MSNNRARRAKGDRLLPMTEDRGFSGRDHQGPTGRHSRGKLGGGREHGGLKWVGTSRVVNRAAKRRASRNSWAKIIRAARREYLASKKPAE